MTSGEESSAEPESAGHFRFESLRRRVISIPALVSFLVAGGFLLFLVTRFDVDLEVTWRQVRSADPWLLLAAFAVHYTTFLFRGARWRLLLQNSARISGDREPVPGILFAAGPCCSAGSSTPSAGCAWATPIAPTCTARNTAPHSPAPLGRCWQSGCWTWCWWPCCWSSPPRFLSARPVAGRPGHWSRALRACWS